MIENSEGVPAHIQHISYTGMYHQVRIVLCNYRVLFFDPTDLGGNVDEAYRRLTKKIDEDLPSYYGNDI